MPILIPRLEKFPMIQPRHSTSRGRSPRATRTPKSGGLRAVHTRSRQGAQRVHLPARRRRASPSIGSFGGLIDTPNIDRLAEGGLRYNNFHTTALCSPSRASIMAGRNPHSIGLGQPLAHRNGLPRLQRDGPGRPRSPLPSSCSETGYVNYALGKWDHTPLYEVSQVGPFDRWPSGEGFHHYYGFMAADCINSCRSCGTTTHRPSPTARRRTTSTQDLADHAIDWITGHMSLKPEDRPS